MTNKYRNARVISWSKNGWKSNKASDEQVKQLSAVRSRIPCYDPVIEPKDSLDADVNIIQAVQSKIQTGSADDQIDSLPNNLKQLIQSEDTWYFGHNKVFKVVDPITQAYDGEWGTDNSEADTDVLAENKSVIRMHLEDTHTITHDTTTEDYYDLMGEILETENGEIIPCAPLVRTDSTVDAVGDEDEDYINEYYQTKYVVPHISDSCKETIGLMIEQLQEKLSDNTITEAEYEILVANCDKEIDKAAARELCVKLDSPYCGYKYSQPRRKYEFILGGEVSSLTKAAQEREEFFYTLFAEAISCNSKDTLFGHIQETIDECGEVKYGRPGGFVGKIRGMYNHDKELAKEWSMVDTDKSISAFTKQRTEFIRELRLKGKDEETIRKAVFRQFDRVGNKIPARYSEDNKLESVSKSWTDSVWRQQRTEALKDLFLTKAQWNAIYDMVNIQKERIKLNNKTSEEEQKALSILRKHFDRIETLADLNNYRTWAEKRSFAYKNIYKQYKDENGKKRERLVAKVNTYKFNKSVTDHLSVINANRWWKAVTNKKRKLQERIKMFNKLDNAIQDTKETNIETAISCIHQGCERMVVGCLQFANLEQNKGHLFVECECGKKTWLISENESGSDIKTYEEAINAYLNCK